MTTQPKPKEHPIIFSTEMAQALLQGRKTQTRRLVKLPNIKDSAKCPYGTVGDLLWVRETFRATPTDFIVYRADYPDPVGYAKWIPSIFMPKIHARIWLKIKTVRTEKLQSITEEGARAEGVEPVLGGYRNYYPKYAAIEYFSDPYYSFLSLWKNIHSSESWDENPLLWVVEFEVISKTGKPETKKRLTNGDDFYSEFANEK